MFLLAEIQFKQLNNQRYSNMKGTLQFIAIFLFCIIMGVAVAHPFGYAIMYLDEFEVNRTIK